MLNMC